ncbi:MAG: xylulokinase [Clostridia bacterium]|nr:xylulokinase [Clostridia bacterium]MBQ7907780.1 xylulokinase [Clostridia bacterium]
MKRYIGIDLGTSSVKLALVLEDGSIEKIVSRSYPISYPQDGWSEQSPEDWYNAALDGICELVSDTEREKIEGISFGGQMHGLVVLDKDDRVIRPAILWNDGRTKKETEYLNTAIGKATLSAYTANIAFAGFTAPKILWLKENEPQNFKKIEKIMLPKDYLAYMLSGEFATDYSDASGMLLLDVKNRCWSREMLNICGVSENQLPKLYESYEKIGTLKSELADRLGLGQVSIIIGAGDNAGAAVGTGTVGNGACNISLGTSGTVFVSQDKFFVDGSNALHSFCHSNGKYHLMGCILSAASCNKWWAEDILGTTDFRAEESECEKYMGENQVFFLPYLMGERSPHNDVNARGAFIGMRPSTSRKEMTLAVLEGVAFALRDCVEIARAGGVGIDKTNICGGGAKSPLWRKIMANVLGIPVVRPQIEEGPAYGGAILAMVGTGLYSTVEAATASLIKAKDTTYPDPELTKKYEEKYQLFKKLYPALKSIYKEF